MMRANRMEGKQKRKATLSPVYLLYMYGFFDDMDERETKRGESFYKVQI